MPREFKSFKNSGGNEFFLYVFVLMPNKKKALSV